MKNRFRRFQFLTVTALVALSAPAMAQGKSRGNDRIPPGQLPAPGMCRVWIDGVPAGQQPAPTDCATAVARRPANARIIYGDRPADARRHSNDAADRDSRNMRAQILGVPARPDSDDKARQKDKDKYKAKPPRPEGGD